MSTPPQEENTAATPGRAARESTPGGRGSSNSRCGPSSDRSKSLPPDVGQWRAIAQLHYDGVISAAEAEVLTGYLWLAAHGVHDERTDRRRRARLRELGVPARSGLNSLAWRLHEAVQAGELPYFEAEAQLGRAALEEASQRALGARSSAGST